MSAIKIATLAGFACVLASPALAQQTGGYPPGTPVAEIEAREQRLHPAEQRPPLAGGQGAVAAAAVGRQQRQAVGDGHEQRFRFHLAAAKGVQRQRGLHA